jgi:hypothetical protein
MNIDQCIKLIDPIWHYGNKGASDGILNAIEQLKQIILPRDFKRFMKWSNGGVCKFPCIYIDFWSAEKIIELNDDNTGYKIKYYLGDHVVAIGSDGGSICFLFDYRSSVEPRFSCVNFGDLDPNEIKIIACSFTEALELALKGDINDEDL